MIQHALSRSSRAAATLCPSPPPLPLATPLIPPQVPHPPRVYSQSTTSRNITRFTVYTRGNAPRVHSGRDVARITELAGNISRMPPALTYRTNCNVGTQQTGRDFRAAIENIRLSTLVTKIMVELFTHYILPYCYST